MNLHSKLFASGMILVVAAAFDGGLAVGRVTEGKEVTKGLDKVQKLVADKVSEAYAAGHTAGMADQTQEFTQPLVALPEPQKPGHIWMPPSRMQGDAFVAVRFGPLAKIPTRCDAGPHTDGCEIQTGHRIPMLELPNPCDTAESYAQLVCHEIGHAHGWDSNHTGGHFAEERTAWAVSVRVPRVDGGYSLWGTSVMAADHGSAIEQAKQEFAGVVKSEGQTDQYIHSDADWNAWSNSPF